MLLITLAFRSSDYITIFFGSLLNYFLPESLRLILYDVTSTYFEGTTCPLAQYGYSRDKKRGKLQIIFGLLCNAAGCPIAVEPTFRRSLNPHSAPRLSHGVRVGCGSRVVFRATKKLKYKCLNNVSRNTSPIKYQ
ncbi:hypothetical protein QUB16_02455 [Microcoleus sp. D3_18a_C4]